jgi:hypothetical protein
MTEEDGTAIGPAARELLIDRQLPRFEVRTFSALLVDVGTNRPARLFAAWTRTRWSRPSRSFS